MFERKQNQQVGRFNITSSTAYLAIKLRIEDAYAWEMWMKSQWFSEFSMAEEITDCRVYPLNHEYLYVCKLVIPNLDLNINVNLLDKYSAIENSPENLLNGFLV